MKKLFILVLLLNSFLYSFDKISLGYGQDGSDINVYNIALKKDFDYKVIKNTNLSLEISAEYLDGSDDNLSIISTQPMLSYDFTEKFYIEGGVGIAYFSDKELDDKKFGMHFQFKESIGLGYRFNDNIDSTLRFTHYSNADIEDDNSGLDILMLNLVYKF